MRTLPLLKVKQGDGLNQWQAVQEVDPAAIHVAALQCDNYLLRHVGYLDPQREWSLRVSDYLELSDIDQRDL